MDRSLHDQLNHAAERLRTRYVPPRIVPVHLHLGTDDQTLVRLPHDPDVDDGLRADLVERALEDLAPTSTLAWITRGGVLQPGDADFSWLSACRQAWGRHGRTLPGFYVVTREGWIDLLA